MTDMNLSKSISKKITQIKKASSAPADLGRMAAEIFLEDARDSRHRKLDKYLLRRKEIGKHLLTAREDLASVKNVVYSILNTLPEDTSSAAAKEGKELTIQKANEIIQSSLDARNNILRQVLNVTRDGDRIFTHSYSDLVITTLCNALSSMPRMSIVVSPGGNEADGIKAANRFAQEGIPVTLIENVSAGSYVNYTNKILVGAEVIRHDGSVIAPAGTSLLAMAAIYAKVPFYVICESLNFNMFPDEKELNLEPRRAFQRKTRTKPLSDVLLRAYQYDLTPSELVTGYITENGIIQPDEIEALTSRNSSQDL